MDESYDIDCYETPPFFAQEVIIAIYLLVNGIYQSTPELLKNSPFKKENAALVARIKEADPESVFRLNNTECVVLCQTMSVMKFYYQHVVIPNTEGKENLTEIETQTKNMYDELMEHVLEMANNIFLLFPSLKEPFYEDEVREKKKKEEAKTLGLDKTKCIISIQLSNQALETHITALFDFFDYFIVNGKSNFSERVREADFCCITEIKEVREMFAKAVKATKRSKKKRTLLSMRDVVVVVMLNNIFQKAYFSDAGDDLHNLFAGSIGDIEDLEAEEVRDYMFKVAKNLEEELCKMANPMDGFEEAMEPIFDFPVQSPC